ncbi:hypothetical protein ACFX1Z_010092 [Malus domestica]
MCREEGEVCDSEHRNFFWLPDLPASSPPLPFTASAADCSCETLQVMWKEVETATYRVGKKVEDLREVI